MPVAPRAFPHCQQGPGVSSPGLVRLATHDDVGPRPGVDPPGTGVGARSGERTSRAGQVTWLVCRSVLVGAEDVRGRARVADRQAAIHIAQGDRHPAVREQALDLVHAFPRAVEGDQPPVRAALDAVRRQSRPIVVGAWRGFLEGDRKSHGPRCWLHPGACRAATVPCTQPVTVRPGRSLPPRIRPRQGAGGTRLAAAAAMRTWAGRDCELSEEPAADTLTTEAIPVPAGTLSPPGAQDPPSMHDGAALLADAPICPYLRHDADGILTVPLAGPTDDHVCTAVGAPRLLSHQQQDLVCRRPAFADCPRYLRGVSAADRSVLPFRSVPRATLVALVILLLSASISFGFVVRRGGIEMPGGSASASTASGGDPSGAPAAAGVATPQPAASDQGVAAPSAVPTQDAGLPSPPASAVTESTAIPEPDGKAIGVPEPDAEALGVAQEQSLRPAQALSRPAELLDLHRQVRRQPVQHRQLLRRQARGGLRMEREIRERHAPSGRRSGPDASAHEVAPRPRTRCALRGSERRGRPPARPRSPAEPPNVGRDASRRYPPRSAAADRAMRRPATRQQARAASRRARLRTGP